MADPIDHSHDLLDVLQLSAGASLFAGDLDASDVALAVGAAMSSDVTPTDSDDIDPGQT
ncbi:hypothetical protein [Deinococcus pimensis]|uniref:hypothetical protein n=1 Tax=Deinococcus pimensis TaxID=309888 RepID=UPI0004B14862|nr:hypothetical protein [Deinococcus pimensis]